MYPDRSKNLLVDSFGEEDKCTSSTETISTNENNLSDDEFMDIVDDFIYSEYVFYIFFLGKHFINY